MLSLISNLFEVCNSVILEMLYFHLRKYFLSLEIPKYISPILFYFPRIDHSKCVIVPVVILPSKLNLYNRISEGRFSKFSEIISKIPKYVRYNFKFKKLPQNQPNVIRLNFEFD